VIDAERFAGSLLRPGDPGYEEARRVHNGMIDKRPAAIVRCRNASDVVEAVRLGRERELELSIRGGGHNVAGTAVTDGGLMIDLAELRGVRVDASARRAQVLGGATWGDVDKATQTHGLAVTGGMISSTGVAGLTLGGGLGWLMGRHGLTVDNLVGAEIVTADARVLRASAEEHPNLFWALRGGGGNFGVVWRLELEVHPVGPLVTAVRAAYPLAAAHEVLALFRGLTTDGPDDLTMNAALLHDPEGSGTPLVGIVGCHVGSPEEAERDLAPLRGLARPVAFEQALHEYTVVNSWIDASYPRGALNYWKSRFLRELSDDVIDAMVARFETCPSTTTSFVIENPHGAVARVPVDATAVPHREAGYNFLITSVWYDPAASDENVAWTRAAFADLEPFTEQRAYSNYLDADEVSGNPVRAAFGPNYDRLVEVKNTYDPDNVFHLNQNIEPRRRKSGPLRGP
jgi:FAD/FMN-containing dehydrogenase